MLGNYQIIHIIGITYWNKIICCSHAQRQTLKSFKLTMTITLNHIEATVQVHNER
jgi:hypothetical protein